MYDMILMFERLRHFVSRFTSPGDQGTAAPWRRSCDSRSSWPPRIEMLRNEVVSKFSKFRKLVFFIVFFLNIGEVCLFSWFNLLFCKLSFKSFGVFRNQKPCWIFVESFCLQFFFLYSSSTFRWSERQKSLDSFGSRDRSGGAAERGVRTTQDDRDRRTGEQALQRIFQITSGEKF